MRVFVRVRSINRYFDLQQSKERARSMILLDWRELSTLTSEERIFLLIFLFAVGRTFRRNNIALFHLLINPSIAYRTVVSQLASSSNYVVFCAAVIPTS